jgi:phage shock protein C
MNCPHCNRDIADYSNFCYFCGARQRTNPPMAGKRLMRSATDVKIGGVCAGMADYFQVDPTVFRLIWAIVAIAVCIVPAIFAYILAWVIMPVAPLPFGAPAGAPQAPTAGPAAG